MGTEPDEAQVLLLGRKILARGINNPHIKYKQLASNIIFNKIFRNNLNPGLFVFLTPSPPLPLLLLSSSSNIAPPQIASFMKSKKFMSHSSVHMYVTRSWMGDLDPDTGYLKVLLGTSHSSSSNSFNIPPIPFSFSVLIRVQWWIKHYCFICTNF